MDDIWAAVEPLPAINPEFDTDEHVHDDPGRDLPRAERIILEGSRLAVREFLRALRAGMREPGGLLDDTLVASSPPAVSHLLEWWSDASRHVSEAAREAWLTGYRATTDLSIVSRSTDSMGEYVARVHDRLSRTAQPLLPEQAWQRLQTALAEELSIGSSRPQIVNRIGAETSWSKQTTFWESRVETLNRRIDAILDPYGPPGTAAREAARLGDAQVRELQRVRASYAYRRDQTRTTWESRANRIARTESGGAYNAGSLDGAIRAGVRQKQWVATFDMRTRSSHTRAHGQTVGIEDRYHLEGGSLLFPGDPTGPAAEVINCRCTQIYTNLEETLSDEGFFGEFRYDVP